MLRGHADHALEPELPELVDRFFGIPPIGLVHDQHRPSRFGTKVLGDLPIFRDHAGRAVDHEEDEVRVLERPAGLIANLPGERRHRRVAVFESARVGQLVAAAVIELDDVRQPIAGHARQIVRERAPFSGEAIEERRLADVRPADDDHFFQVVICHAPYISSAPAAVLKKLSAPFGTGLMRFRFQLPAMLSM